MQVLARRGEGFRRAELKVPELVLHPAVELLRMLLPHRVESVSDRRILATTNTRPEQLKTNIRDEQVCSTETSGTPEHSSPHCVAKWGVSGFKWQANRFENLSCRRGPRSLFAYPLHPPHPHFGETGQVNGVWGSAFFSTSLRAARSSQMSGFNTHILCVNLLHKHLLALWKPLFPLSGNHRSCDTSTTGSSRWINIYKISS